MESRCPSLSNPNGSRTSPPGCSARTGVLASITPTSRIHWSGGPLRLDNDVAADASEAEGAIARFDAKAVALADTEALARLLLRAESVASSKIEGLARIHHQITRPRTTARLRSAFASVENTASIPSFTESPAKPITCTIITCLGDGCGLEVGSRRPSPSGIHRGFKARCERRRGRCFHRPPGAATRPGRPRP